MHKLTIISIFEHVFILSSTANLGVGQAGTVTQYVLWLSETIEVGLMTITLRSSFSFSVLSKQHLEHPSAICLVMGHSSWPPST